MAGELSEAWRLWPRLLKLMSLRALVFDALFSSGALEWRADYVSGLRRSRLTDSLVELVAPIEARELQKLHLIAVTNGRRLSNIARWTAIAFVTLPVSVAVTMAELDSALGQRVADEFLGDAGQLTALGLIGLCVLYQILRAWQGQQVVTRLEFAMLDRDVFPAAGAP